MSFDVIHSDDLTNSGTLIELSHVVRNVMIGRQESLVALLEREGGMSLGGRVRVGGVSCLEIDDIDFIKTNQSHKEANIHRGDLIRWANEAMEVMNRKKRERESREDIPRVSKDLLTSIEGLKDFIDSLLISLLWLSKSSTINSFWNGDERRKALDWPLLIWG
jgi:hypothetical protein